MTADPQEYRKAMLINWLLSVFCHLAVEDRMKAKRWAELVNEISDYRLKAFVNP